MAQRSSRSSFLSLISTNRSGAVRQERSSRGGNSTQPKSNRPRRRRRSATASPKPASSSPTLPIPSNAVRQTPTSTQPPSPPQAQPLQPQPPQSQTPQPQPRAKTKPTPVTPPRKKRQKTQPTRKLRRRSSSRPGPSTQKVKRSQQPPQTPASPVVASSQAVFQRKRRRTSPMVYGARLLILGIGIGVISGTVLSVLSSLGRLGAPTQVTESSMASGDNLASQSRDPVGMRTIPLELQLHQEDKILKNEITNLAAGLSQLNLGLMFVDLNTGSYVDIEGESSFPSASTIKIPILVAFFQAVDAGKIRLDEMLTMEDQHIAGGSGDMQYQPSGSQYTALETAAKMIVISDNTATNMLIDRLGGPEALNKKFMDWGLKDTVLRNLLPDLPGANKTSPKDLLSILSQVNQGGLISMRSRDRMFHIMEQTENNALLPSGIGAEAIIAHKTGTLNSVLGDVGLIDMTNGKRYLLAVLVGRRDGNPDAEYLIQNISQLVYQTMRTIEPIEEDIESQEDSETEENNDLESDSELEDENWEDENWEDENWEDDV
ncbi:MAG: serine hydrolase [Microcoleaceae cyanobacterium]